MSFRLRVLLIVAGVLLHSRLPSLPEGWSAASCFVLALLLLVTGWLLPLGQRFYRLQTTLCVLILPVAGFFWAMWMVLQQFEQRLPLTLEGEDFWLIGRVEGIPLQDAESEGRRSSRIDLRVEKACLRLLPEHCEQQGYSSVMAGTRVTLNDYSGLGLQSGERWQLRVRINRPHGFANPGAYDFEAAQFQRGVMARGYIRETRYNQRLPSSRLDPILNMSRWRYALASKIDEAGKELQNIGLIKALVIGERQGISNEQWELFTATGTNHLVVISGLHVGFVALCIWQLVNRLLRLWPRLLLYLPAQHGAALAAIAAAALYSLLAGFSLPTQRALIMVTVLMWARLSGRQTRPGDSLALAALIIVLADPLAMVTAGFWLSFMAVASLFVVFAGFNRQPEMAAQHWWEHSWQRWIQPQWAISVGLLLPLIIWTGQTSLTAPVANLFAIPLVSLLVVPLSLCGALLLALHLPGGGLALLLADLLSELLQWMLEFFVSWTPGLWRPPMPSLPAMVLAGVGCLMLLLPKGLVPRWQALMLLLPLVWSQPPKRPAFGDFEVQFLDVGQGLSVVIHTQNHDLLFDTGPALGPDFDAARAAILPYLQRRGIRELDTLLVSHWHADHSGGLASVLKEIPVNRLMAGGNLAGFAGLADTDMQLCQAGQQWLLDGVEFSILFPPAGHTASSPNNYSCVLKIRAGQQQVLLTGDIEAEAERWLLSQYRNQLEAQLVQAPHHGSRTSSTAAFVQAVSPLAVVFPAGHHNRFGHPHPEVVSRYQNAGARLYNPAAHGALHFYVSRTENTPELLSAWRRDHKKYWLNQPGFYDEYGN